MQTTLALLLLGFSAVSAHHCASIPPALWCSSEELSKQCGFEKFCTRHTSASYNKPINITLLYEGLCGGCQQWITEEVYPTVFKNFAGFVNIELVPFGNADITNGSITCQHGEEECRINRFESCVIHVVETQDHYVPLIFCIEKYLESGIPLENATAECFKVLSVSDEVQKKIQSCVHSHVGDDLQQKAAEKTANVWPEQHTWVPWVIVDGVSATHIRSLIDNLPYYLCEWYIGDERYSILCVRREERIFKKVFEEKLSTEVVS